MSFIGIIANNATYECIKKKIPKQFKAIVINITKQDIENIKNIRFETVLICENIEMFNNKIECLDNIISNAKYLVINSDINIDTKIFANKRMNIITFGLNQKATVTVSSIREDGIMVSLQRNIENSNGKIIEEQEINIKSNNVKYEKIYALLARCIIMLIYNIELQDNGLK